MAVHVVEGLGVESAGVGAAAAEAAVAGWRNQVVRPMRQLRRRLKREMEGFPPEALEALLP